MVINDKKMFTTRQVADLLRIKTNRVTRAIRGYTTTIKSKYGKVYRYTMSPVISSENVTTIGTRYFISSAGIDELLSHLATGYSPQALRTVELLNSGVIDPRRWRVY